MGDIVLNYCMFPKKCKNQQTNYTKKKSNADPSCLSFALETEIKHLGKKFPIGGGGVEKTIKNSKFPFLKPKGATFDPRGRGNLLLKLLELKMF